MSIVSWISGCLVGKRWLRAAAADLARVVQQVYFDHGLVANVETYSRHFQPCLLEQNSRDTRLGATRVDGLMVSLETVEAPHPRLPRG